MNVHDEIQVYRYDRHVRLQTTAWYGPIVIIKNWFTGEHYRHAVFVTADDIIFKLADDIDDPYLLQPIIIDASKEQAPVLLDASKKALKM